MLLEGIPSLTFGQRFDAPAFGSCSYRCCHNRTPFVSSSSLRMGRCGRKDPITGLFPQAKPSEERIGVVARPASLRQLFQFFEVASSQNYVVGLEGGDQAGNHIRDMASPFLF